MPVASGFGAQQRNRVAGRAFPLCEELCGAGSRMMNRACLTGQARPAAVSCMTPLFDVSSDRYVWLTQSLFIARGRLAGPKRIDYELSRVV